MEDDIAQALFNSHMAAEASQTEEAKLASQKVAQPKQQKSYLQFEGLTGQVYQAYRDEFAPSKMSRAEKVE